MENKIQKLFKPMESPRIFGPNTFPSNCIKMIIKTKNKTPLLGLAIKTNTALGIIPMYWPKNGMMFVTPINTLIKMVYGIPAMFIMINVNTPTIRESIIFPLINFAKTPCVSLNTDNTLPALFAGRTAKISFFA